ncbi:hypothetical protein D3C87_1019820 [compost metagenome]
MPVSLLVPHVEHVRRAVVRAFPVTAGDQHVELAGLHIDLVDVRPGHVQRAVVTALHDGQLARRRETAQRLGIHPGVGGVHIESRLLHFVAVVHHQRRVGDGVQLLAVVADREGEHRLGLLTRLLGDAGVEHLLAVVQFDTIDIRIVIVQHVGGLAIRRQLHGAGTEGVGHLAGLEQGVGGQVDHVQVVRVVGGHHVFVTDLQRGVFIGQNTDRTAAQDGERGQAAGFDVTHAGILLL